MGSDDDNNKVLGEGPSLHRQQNTVPLSPVGSPPPPYTYPVPAMAPRRSSASTTSSRGDATESTPFQPVDLGPSVAAPYKVPAPMHSHHHHAGAGSRRRAPNSVGYAPETPMSPAGPPPEQVWPHGDYTNAPGCCGSTTGACCFSAHGACCFSDNEACCFSDHGGCCFSDHGACCFSDHEACCFSNHKGCAFSDNGGCCCNLVPGPPEMRQR